MSDRSRPELNLFLVGAPKTGSTLLTNLLALHPRIYLAEHKDQHFFATDLTLRAPIRDPDAYWAMYDGWTDEDRVGEASVFYLYSEAALREISSRFGDSGVVVQIRNPVELVHSYHWQMVYVGSQSIVDFERAWEHGLGRRRAGEPAREDFEPRLLDYDYVGTLSVHIRRWLEAFGEDRVRLVLFDDLIDDPKGVLGDLFVALGVDPAVDLELDAVLGDRKAKNPRKVRRFGWVRDLIQQPAPWLRTLVRRLLPTTAIRARVAALVDRFNRRYLRTSELAPEVRRRLERHFEPEIRRLERLVGRDLDHWLRE